MFANYPIYPSLPATDLERAKRFYADKLGLTPESELEGGLFYRCGKDSRFSVFTSQGKASGTHTQAMWLDDVPSLSTVNSIATIGTAKGAWFKDSEGNLLSLAQFV